MTLEWGSGVAVVETAMMPITQTMATRFVLLTDCAVMRLGFEALAQGDPDVDFAGAAMSDAEALALIDLEKPSVVVLDHAVASGAERLCRIVHRHHPTLPVLVLSDALDDAAVRGSIDAGAQGFMYKDAPPEDIKSALVRLGQGESVLDPRVTGRVIEWASQRPVEIADGRLSSREIDVVRRVAHGESNKQIAKRLGLTENTVKTYLRRAYRKLDCQTRSAAAAVVARWGL